MFFMKLWWSMFVLAIGWGCLFLCATWHLVNFSGYEDVAFWLVIAWCPLLIVFWLRWLFAPSIQKLPAPIWEHPNSSSVG